MAFVSPEFAALGWPPPVGKAWAMPMPMPTPMVGWGAPPPALPPGGCGTIMGPVGKVCSGSVPTSRTVPMVINQMVPTTSVMPLPSGVRPETFMGPPITVGVSFPPAGPVPGAGPYAKGPAYGAYGKGGPAPGFGGMVPPGESPY